MHPLDRVIWNALTGPQANLAEVAGTARRFPVAITTLGALAEPNEEGFASLAELQKPGETTALFLDEVPKIPARWKLVHNDNLSQMVHEGVLPAAATNNGFVTLGTSDAAEMLALAQLTKPGPFGMRTGELGEFIGVRKAGNLVAMSGVRLHPPGYVEISAVCTHPDHLGKGYAGRLMTEIMHRIRSSGETPMLHVRSSNSRAIKLYERLGFKLRREFQLCVVAKVLP
jgi:ribosomal protein S18 acetylase RimI-like enzyme